VLAKVAGALAVGLLPWIADRSSPIEREPRWVVVADFDGPDEPLPLASTARNVVDAALHRSGALALVSDGELRLGKRSVGVPDTTRLTLPLAREIALRGDFDVVVTGRVESSPGAYALTLRAVRADSGSAIALRTGSARSPDEFIALARRLGREMEDELARGRHAVAPSLQRAGRIWPVTNSFAAYREFMLAQHARGATGSETAPLVPLRAAVRLDTTFAEAWMALGTVFANLGMPDSARVAYAAARRHADPADAYTMMFLDAYDAKLRHDREGTRRAWAAVIERFPWSQRATANYAVSLERLQRYEEAVAAGRFAMAKERGFHTAVTRANLARSLASLGRWDEARHALTLDGIAPEERGQLYIELGAERWEAAERVIALQLHPGRRTETRRRAMVASASLAALRGDVALAARALREAMRLERVDESPASARRAVHALLLLAVATGDTTLLPALPDQDDGADAGARLLRGLVAAARGDTVTAARVHATLRALSADDAFELGIGQQLLEAWLLARAGRLDAARRLLLPALRTHGWDDDAEQLWTLARWLYADVSERAGDRVAAARALTLAVDPVEALRVEELELRGLVLPAARRRLARLSQRSRR
jgi:tetratricopeptide (TPR) repeat protein